MYSPGMVNSLLSHLSEFLNEVKINQEVAFVLRLREKKQSKEEKKKS